MTSFAHADIFFLISSIGFVVVVIVAVVFLALCIKAIISVTNILRKIESNVDTIGDATKDLIEDLRQNVVFRMLFGAKAKKVHRIKK